MQARLQLKALTLVRPIKTARLWARDKIKARTVAQELTDELGISVFACESRDAAVAGADIIVTTTPAGKPILTADQLERGQHITAMGSDAEHKNEIDPQVIAKSDLYVADSIKQTRRLGELHHAIEAGLIGRDQMLPELGQIVAQQHQGRTSREQISIADLTGTGMQDTAIANYAFALAKKRGMIISSA